MKVAGDVIVVVGGTSGIGLSTAIAAQAAEAEVVIVGRDQNRLDRALEGLGGSARGFTADASDPHALRSLFEGLGRVDHLVVAASGGAGGGPFATLSLTDLQQGFDAKFTVQWQCAQAALAVLAPAGSITFVTAASSRTGNPNTSGLAAINGALAAMVLPLAHELAPRRVNAVSPGVIDTPWWDRQPAGMKDQFFGLTAATVPAGRVGTPDEVADAILFLAGNGYVTGVVLDVDGGMRSVQLG